MKAVGAAYRVLKTLCKLDGAGVTTAADCLNLSKASTHSHLVTLVENKFVVKRGDKYHASLRFVDFGEYANTASTSTRSQR